MEILHVRQRYATMDSAVGRRQILLWCRSWMEVDLHHGDHHGRRVGLPMALAMVLFGNWQLGVLEDYFRHVFERIPALFS